MQKETYHIPVLMDEVLEGLALKPKGVYFDATFGGGGHSSMLLEADPTIKVIGFDWDQNAIDNAQPLLEKYGDRLQLIWGSFAHLYKLIKKNNLPQPHGVLADFGTSQFQIHERDGFSVFNNTKLDMRMSQSHFKVTAADIVNHAAPEELRQIFWRYGEERNAKKIVELIEEVRRKKKITTTKQLADLVSKVTLKKGKIHPATRVFQALRIVVNKELENIEAFLPAAFNALRSGGRLACISFHSLEDRPVKMFYKEKVDLLQGVAISKKPIIATEGEIERNAASRSAKLRVIEKK
jgi:16S rRNA (cytosine1402-N4)-methyltransferase